MKKNTLLVVCLFLFSNATLKAQTWNNGGNTLSANGSIGTKSSHSLLFKTSNIERGRITNGGNWGIGTTSPGGKFHINSASGQHALRVQVNGGTKMLVHSNGGVAFGVNAPPPANGLLVNGNVLIGTATATLSENPKLEVVASSSSSTGIIVTAELYGLRAFTSSLSGAGINGSSRNIGVYGQAFNGSSYSIGVYGDSDKGNGVVGTSHDGVGVEGFSTNGVGGKFESINSHGLHARTTNDYYAAVFYGNTLAFGSYLGSDKNIKKNIQEVSNALSIINQLKPKHYEFRDDGQYATLHLPKGNHYGLLAQDVEEVLPHLVKESTHKLNNLKEEALKPAANGKPAISAIQKEPTESMKIKAVNYTELIPLLIKGMQEQQQTIHQQQQTISTLTERIGKLEKGSSAGENINITNPTGISLEQNTPNPAHQTTTIKYTIPARANAQIFIYEAITGKLLKTLTAPATGQVHMNTSDLKPGTYVYTLMVDGKLAASKQMVLLAK